MCSFAFQLAVAADSVRPGPIRARLTSSVARRTPLWHRVCVAWWRSLQISVSPIPPIAQSAALPAAKTSPSASAANGIHTSFSDLDRVGGGRTSSSGPSRHRSRLLLHEVIDDIDRCSSRCGNQGPLEDHPQQRGNKHWHFNLPSARSFLYPTGPYTRPRYRSHPTWPNPQLRRIRHRIARFGLHLTPPSGSHRRW